VRHSGARFVVIIPAGIQGTVVAWEVAAADLHSQQVTGRPVDARLHGLEGDLVHLASLIEKSVSRASLDPSSVTVTGPLISVGWSRDLLL